MVLEEASSLSERKSLLSRDWMLHDQGIEHTFGQQRGQAQGFGELIRGKGFVSHGSARLSRNLIPAPPPFSGMNSIPAFSKLD